VGFGVDEFAAVSSATNPATRPATGPATDDAIDVSAVSSLLDAVRRRLWRDRFIEAMRFALWAWAAILAAAATLHLAVGQPGFATALAIGAGACLVALAWAALRRPTRAGSALFADRVLGGESAYSTWLETGGADGGVQHSAARQRLAQWTAAAVPSSRAALAAFRTPTRLTRPLAAAGICTVVAALVTALPVAERGMRGDSAREDRDGPRPAEALSVDDDALARELAAELATSARPSVGSSVGPEDPGRGSMRREDGTEGATPVAEVADPSAARSPAPREGERPATSGETAVAALTDESSVGVTDADFPADGSERASAARAAGNGREAGTSRDELAATEGSPVLPGALTVQRRDMTGPGDEAARQADMAQAGIYDGDTAAANGARIALPTVAAARPPAAQREAALSPVEAAYVAAWAEAVSAAQGARR
jgi:hypothetical protein